MVRYWNIFKFFSIFFPTELKCSFKQFTISVLLYSRFPSLVLIFLIEDLDFRFLFIISLMWRHALDLSWPYSSNFCLSYSILAFLLSFTKRLLCALYFSMNEGSFLDRSYNSSFLSILALSPELIHGFVSKRFCFLVFFFSWHVFIDYLYVSVM